MIQKYQLYIGILQEIPAGVEYSYYDSRRRRMFVLADWVPDGKFVPVPPEMLSALDPGERRWFNDSCLAINQKWLAEHHDDAMEQANALLDLFAEELQAELKKKENGDGGENNETAE